MGVEDKKFQHYGGSLKNPIFTGRADSQKNPINREDCLKRELGL